jgi:hypothetical protein
MTQETVSTPSLRVNIEVVPQPMVEEWMMFAEPSSLVEAINKGESPRVSVRLKTKTRVGLSIKGGDGSWSMNLPSAAYKTHEQKGYSYATHRETVSNYFVLSKKQGYTALLEYIKECVTHILGDHIAGELTVQLNDTSDLRSIRAKFD